MKTFYLLLALLISSTTAPAQQQVNNWNYTVDLPANYNPSFRYPTIIFIPGVGEVGTDTNRLISMGPTRFLRDGGQIPGFIVISLQPPTPWPTEYTVNIRIETLKTLYGIDPNRINLTGLSMGGWTALTYISGGYPNIRSVIGVESVIAEDNQPYPQVFANYPGKLLLFEQRLDGRGGLQLANYLNTIHPGNAQFIETNYGNGGHCCFQRIYDGTPYMIFGKLQSIYEWWATINNDGVLALPTAPNHPSNTITEFSQQYNYLSFRAKGIGTYNIYNMLGQRVISNSYRKGVNKIFTGFMPSGIYYLQCNYKTFKFIV